ncbi:MAG: hypothetical protein NUW22_16340 [Acidobacteria bacterium]|nr:hypothetical protein [Acidobacteriota bacterium]
MKSYTKALMGALVMAVAASVVLSAQASVTLTLRSGDTMGVTLVDLKAGGFEVEVRGASRMIPKDQVAMVDFGGNVTVRQSWFNDMTAVDHLVVFKNGDTLLTEWTDVGGTSPLILRFRGEREIPSTDVARIYLVRPGGNVTRNDRTPASGGAQSDGSIAVMAADPWTDSGITVRTGDYLRFDVSRDIRFGEGDDDISTADGNVAGRARSGILRRVPVASLPVGGLIGKVGTGGQPFSIGSAPQAIRMPANGRLMLGINDLTFNDNAGWFRVVVTRGR